jgi:hypothetical protein
MDMQHFHLDHNLIHVHLQRLHLKVELKFMKLIALSASAAVVQLHDI